MPRRPYKAALAVRTPSRHTLKTVAVIGTGLIGSSIGLAAQAAGFKVFGWDSNARALRGARERGAVNVSARTLHDAVASAAIVILAAPLDQVLLQMPAVFAHAQQGALIMDVAGVKEPVAKRAVTLLRRRGDIRFVAGHPIAGSERSGPGAADADLLKGRAFALHAPAQAMRTQAHAAAAGFVRALGAVPFRIAPREHDRAIAMLSALPQLTAIALALASTEESAERGRRLAGPGYRDATRLALSGFGMWKPALSSNLKNVLRSVRALGKRVERIEDMLRRRDWAALEQLFSDAARARRRVNPR